MPAVNRVVAVQHVDIQQGRVDDCDKATPLERAEANERHNYEMLLQDLTNQIESATSARGEKATAKAQMEQEKAEAEGATADTQQSVEQDQKYSADLSAECAQKSTDYEKRQELRKAEVQAMQQAIEILSSDRVAGAGQMHLSGVQLYGFTSYVQVRTSSGSTNMLKLQGKAAAFLMHRARRTESKVLSLVAERASSDPFKKVSRLIKDMIVKLMEEANEEAEHKGFCDAELGQNKLTRDAKSEEAESLKASIQELSADTSKLGQDIADLQAAVADIDEAVEKATDARTAEKAKNALTVSDAKVAQEAVAQAISVLKDFYTKAGDATALPQTNDGHIEYDTRALAILGAPSAALAQESAPGAPATFDGAYSGMASGGVVGMLEVIESDFARLESETSSADEEAQRTFDEFSADSATDKAVKTTDVRHKETAKQSKESALARAKKDLRATQEELDAALEYFDKLKPTCVDAGQSYEERVARRKEEIESLQDALKILSGEDIA
jgi:chromosome segregation ATPase